MISCKITNEAYIDLPGIYRGGWGDSIPVGCPPFYKKIEKHFPHQSMFEKIPTLRNFSQHSFLGKNTNYFRKWLQFLKNTI